MTFDINKIRSDFPSLALSVNDKPVIFLDSAASALKPTAVIDAMSQAMAGRYANIHRGLYDFSAHMTGAYEQARETVAKFINANHENEIVFTRGATEGINLVAHSWGRKNLSKGDGVLITALEHHANIVPWHFLREELGIALHVVDIHDDGTLNMDDFHEKIKNPAIKMMSVLHVSNALGTILPIKEMIDTAKNLNKTVMVDACQSVVHDVLDIQDLGADFVVFSGHKLYGPTGIGILWGKEELLNAMPPYQGGGDMIDTVSFDAVTYQKAPARFEAGTPAIIEAIGLKAAIDYLGTLDADERHDHELGLAHKLYDGLSAIEGVNILTPKQAQPSPIVSFTLEGIHPHDAATLLDKYGVAVRVGHHCAEPLMRRLGVNGTIRASIGLYNTSDDIDALLIAIENVKKFF